MSATEFNGLPENSDLSIRSHEHIINARKNELTEILHDLLKDDWVEAGGVNGWYGLTLKLDAVVYEEAAISHIIGRDFRVKSMKVCDDGKLQVSLEIFEWEN